jgi:hypothetical protein
MASILDIAPPEAEKVAIRGVELEIRGIGNAEFAKLLGRFPELRKAVSGAIAGDGAAAEQIGGVMPAVIAAGFGQCGDESVEAAVVERLSIGEQSDLFGRIMKLTMPEAPKGPLPDDAAAQPAIH